MERFSSHLRAMAIFPNKKKHYAHYKKTLREKMGFIEVTVQFLLKLFIFYRKYNA